MSIKEALEAARSLIGSIEPDECKDDNLLYLALDVDRLIRHALAQLESADTRERIARIIDPAAFGEPGDKAFESAIDRWEALEKADAILATGLVPDEAEKDAEIKTLRMALEDATSGITASCVEQEIRADEREKCAKAAEDVDAYGWPLVEGAQWRSPTASMKIAIAAAIRAGRDQGSGMSDFDTRPRYGHNHSNRSVYAWTKITYMAHAKHYVMVRRPHCTPFVLTEKQWLAFPLWEGQPDWHGPFPAGRRALAEQEGR